MARPAAEAKELAATLDDHNPLWNEDDYEAVADVVTLSDAATAIGEWTDHGTMVEVAR